MGQSVEAIPHAWQAFQLYEEEDSRLRALGDVGVMLLSLGDATGAERALAEVFRRGRTRESVSNAVIELRSEEHTSELQSLRHLVCRLLLEKKKKTWEVLTEGTRDNDRHNRSRNRR